MLQSSAATILSELNALRHGGCFRVKAWLRLTLVTLTVGGGFLGFVLILPFFESGPSVLHVAEASFFSCFTHT
jgi:hypothetical protein